jgi:hypothetical protein
MINIGHLVEYKQIVTTNMPEKLTRVEKLIWSFLFTEKTHYDIDIDKYCKSDERADFRENMRQIILKGKKRIIEDRIVHFEEKVIWKIEIGN